MLLFKAGSHSEVAELRVDDAVHTPGPNLAQPGRRDVHEQRHNRMSLVMDIAAANRPIYLLAPVITHCAKPGR